MQKNKFESPLLAIDRVRRGKPTTAAQRAQGLKKHTVLLDAESEALAKQHGANLSAGLRTCAKLTPRLLALPGAAEVVQKFHAEQGDE